MKLLALNIELIISEPWIIRGAWIMKCVNRNEPKWGARFIPEHNETFLMNHANQQKLKCNDY